MEEVDSYSDILSANGSSKEVMGQDPTVKNLVSYSHILSQEHYIYGQGTFRPQVGAAIACGTTCIYIITLNRQCHPISAVEIIKFRYRVTCICGINLLVN